MAQSTPLLLSRRFAPLFWCQFFSAFSDNFLKNALVFLILFKIGGTAAESLITLAAAVFIAPYFFLSAFGGEMADRYDKAVVAQRLKLAEIGVAIIAISGFVMHSVPILFLALFGFGLIGSMFGPIKYGILPDLLQRSELPAANALVEGATFMAILLGTIVGGMAAKGGGDPASFAGLMLVFALLCWGAALFIPRVGSGAPHLTISVNIIASTGRLLTHLRGDRRLWWGALVTSWFWLVGAVVLSLLPPLVKSVLGGTEEVVTAFLAIFSIAVAVGSGLAAWLAAGRIVILPTLIGAVLLGVFAVDLGWTTYGMPLALVPAGVGEVFASRLRTARDDRSRRSCDRRRPLHRADLCRGAGLGRRRSPRARDRRRQRAQRRLHGGRYGGDCRACRRSTSPRRCCSSASGSPPSSSRSSSGGPCRQTR